MGSQDTGHTVRILRTVDAVECAQRNALTTTPPGLVLQEGQTGTVLETLEGGNAFLVEVGEEGPSGCSWLGVLYASELESQPDVSVAA